MDQDPIGYTIGKTIQFSGFVDLKDKMGGSIAKISADFSDPQTQLVLQNNFLERTRSSNVFEAKGSSAVYANNETETGELHQCNLPKIMSEVALKDAMTSAPEEFGLGDIDFG
ncbi:MAG: hypothetical protein RLZZ361_480 [Cyanobacteriota bacterium]|jgi:hypothetical protein